MKSSAATRASNAASLTGSSWAEVMRCFSSSVVYMIAPYNKPTERSINDSSADGSRKPCEHGNILAVGGHDPHLINAGAAGNALLLRLGDEPVALLRRREKDDRSLLRQRVHIVRVAGIGEGRVGEQEDHAAMGERVAVEHVRAYRHRRTRIPGPRLLQHDAQRAACAFAFVQVLGGAARQLVRHTEPRFVDRLDDLP